MSKRHENLELTITNNISALLAYWDKNLICRFANNSYFEWFGLTHDQLVGKMTLRELLGPIYEKNEIYIKAVLNGERQTFEREIITPDGQKRNSLANYYPDIVNNEVLGFFVHVADITPIKKSENSLMKSTAIITSQNNRLINFANIVSHNLRTYAFNLDGILGLLEEADSEETKATMMQHLRNISKDFNQTIDNLNEIVKIQNDSDLPLIDIQINEFIELIKNILESQISSTNTTIINNISPNQTIRTNPGYFESIVLNFVSNAIKYRAEDRNPIIELSCYTLEDEICLEIKDNGKGINLEKNGKDLFGMYKTFHGNKDAQGIGLFISKYQVEILGGRIVTNSQVDQGTIFQIYFTNAK